MVALHPQLVVPLSPDLMGKLQPGFGGGLQAPAHVIELHRVEVKNLGLCRLSGEPHQKSFSNRHQLSVSRQRNLATVRKFSESCGW